MRTALLSLVALSLACPTADAPLVGLARAPEGNGPQIQFDLTERPLPNIPFPSDLATRGDIKSPTGKRINAALVAPTVVESEARQHIDQLDGFGTFAPISVGFDRVVDLSNIKQRHFQDPMDFSDDVMYVVNIDPNNKKCGEAVPLESGQGNFPILLEQPGSYFPNDYRKNADNLLFEAVNEDSNGNGLLDPGEDTDFDGLLDFPNTISEDENGVPNGDPRDDLATFYERETNTLIARPLVPLQEQSRYAVVLTKRLTDKAGEPVRSPFPFINHVEQTEDLQSLINGGFCPSFTSGDSILSRLGLSFSSSDGGDVAFAWSFTTQTVTRDLVAIRQGLYGEGAFGYLSEKFPTDKGFVVERLIDKEQPELNVFLLPADLLISLVGDFADALGSSEEELQAVSESLRFVDYFVMGSYESPSFMTDPKTGKHGLHNPDGTPRKLTNDEIVRFVFDVDYRTGRSGAGQEVGADRGAFLMTVPKPTPGHAAPFPVSFYGHGYTSSRFEALGFAGNLARHGIATVALDAYGHGLALDPGQDALALGLASQKGLGGTWKAITNGRARDLNGDEIEDSGADLFTGYLFHTRDTVRQSVIDYMQFIRIMRSWDGTRRFETSVFDRDGDGKGDAASFDGQGTAPLAGDFNNDGVVDIGGPSNEYYAFGQSLGGIFSMVLVAADPAIVAGAPTSGGGGMVEIGLRSVQGGVKEAVLLRTLGPIYFGLNNDEGGMDLAVTLPDLNNDPILRLATFATQPEVGDILEITNLKTGEVFQGGFAENNAFRVPVEADKGDALKAQLFSATGELKETIESFGKEVDFQADSFAPGDPFVSLGDGFGTRRNSPEIRRFLGLAQLALEPTDPINYAPHVFQDPLYVLIDGKEKSAWDHPGQGTPIRRRVLVLGTQGDMNVPVSTSYAYARAAGLLDFMNANPAYASLDDDGVPGVSNNGIILQTKSAEAIERFKRFAGAPFNDNRSTLFDVDDMDESLDCYRQYCTRSDGCSGIAEQNICDVAGDFRRFPQMQDIGLPPLRANVSHGDGTFSGVRNPTIDGDGEHGFAMPLPSSAFDIHTYLVHYIGRFFREGTLEQDLCLEDGTCPDIAQFEDLP